MDYLLHIVILLPAFGALLVYGLKSEFAKVFAIIVATLELILALMLLNGYDSELVGIYYFSKFELISHFGISYAIGIDSIALFLIILNAFVTLLALALCKDLSKALIIAVLCLESIVMGVFSALDAIIFYIFWELSLLPVLYIIGVCGGKDRIYASVKYFIYTFSASLAMLLGILYYAYQYALISGVWSFNMAEWAQVSLEPNMWLFMAFFIAMAVKMPLFPLHSWQPYVYTQAPIIGSALLSGVLSKMGCYGLIRIVLPLFPIESAESSFIVAIICVIMVIYGAFLALAQSNIKTLLAYASLSHMGIIVLGIFSFTTEGLSGAVFFMLGHGIIVSSLFLIIGIIESKLNTQEIASLQGLAHNMPSLSTNFGIIMMASLGLPLTIGFVGEVLCLYGYFQVNKIMAFLAGFSLIVGAIYMLVLFKRVFFGESVAQNSHISDLSCCQKLCFLPILALVIVLGVYPKVLLDPLSLELNSLSQYIQAKQGIEEFQDDEDRFKNLHLFDIKPMINNDDKPLLIPQLGD